MNKELLMKLKKINVSRKNNRFMNLIKLNSFKLIYILDKLSKI